MRLLLTLIGGVVALAALKSVSQLHTSPFARRTSTAPRALSLPRHYNRLAIYYRVHLN
jgi:hypothetical protein